jgi:O-antigen ligase
MSRSIFINFSFFFTLLAISCFSVLGNASIVGVKAYVILILIFFIGSVFFSGIAQFFRVFLKPVSVSFFLLLLSFLASGFFANWNDTSVTDIIKLSIFYLFSIAFYVSCKKYRLSYSTLFYVFAFVAFIHVFILLDAISSFGWDKFSFMIASGQAFSGAPLFTNYIVEVFDQSIIGNSQNVYSSILVSYFFILLVFRVFSSKSILSTVVFYLSFFSYLVIVLLSLSKTSMIIFFVLTFFYLMYFSPLKGLFIAVLSIIVIFLIGVGDLIYNRFSSMFNSDSADVTMSSRQELWDIALNIIEEHPWFGIGFRVANDLFIQGSVDSVNNPHNIVLRILVDGGFLSLVLFLALIGYMTYQLVMVNLNKRDGVFYFVKWFVFLFFMLKFMSYMFAFQLTEFDLFLVVPIIYHVFCSLKNYTSLRENELYESQ